MRISFAIRDKFRSFFYYAVLYIWSKRACHKFQKKIGALTLMKIRDLTLTKIWDLTLLKIGALTLYLSTDNLYL